MVRQRQRRPRPAKVHKMLKSYGDAQGEATKLQQKQCKWHVMVFRESMVASTGTEVVVKGKMMWEREAIEYWKSTPGGGLPEDEAVARWEDWVRNKHQMCLIHDMKGPNTKNH